MIQTTDLFVNRCVAYVGGFIVKPIIIETHQIETIPILFRPDNRVFLLGCFF